MTWEKSNHDGKGIIMNLKGKKVALLIADMYEDLEAWYPYFRLKEEGAEVTVVGAEGAHSYTSKHGYPMKSDAAADEVRASDFDAVVIPGGYAPDHMRRSDAMVEFVRQAAEAKLPMAAICHGAWMMCCVPGLLEGKKATSFPGIRWDLTNAGAKWVDQEVCVDGDIITSRRPGDLMAFCKAIMEALAAAIVER